MSGGGWEGEREKEGLAPTFPSSHRSPHALYFSIIAILLGYPLGAFAEERVIGLSVLYSPCMGEESYLYTNDAAICPFSSKIISHPAFGSVYL